MRARGFTLIEVLVALAIVAVALLAATRAMGVMAASSADLRLRLLAQLSAENRIAWLHATRAFPAVGETIAPCPQGDAALVCRESVASTPNADFRRVEIRVHTATAPDIALATLVGILPREPVAATPGTTR